MIDFDKFKASILRYKKDSASLNKEETANTGLELGHQDESLFFNYEKENHNDPASGWTLKAAPAEKNGVKYILHSKANDKGIQIMRNEITLRGIRRDTFLDFACNFDK